MSDLIPVNEPEAQADMLAHKMPDGDCYSSKYIEDQNIRLWLTALGTEFIRLEQFMNYTHNQMELSNTIDLISDFEKDYGIGSSCFASQVSDDLQVRINNILTMIASNGTSTEEQFEYLATLLGFDVDVSCCSTEASITAFPYTFPITFPAEVRDDRFVIYVTVNDVSEDEGFPYTFPITFKASATNIMECFFNILKPAHTILVFNYTG